MILLFIRDYLMNQVTFEIRKLRILIHVTTEYCVTPYKKLHTQKQKRKRYTVIKTANKQTIPRQNINIDVTHSGSKSKFKQRQQRIN